MLRPVEVIQNKANPEIKTSGRNWGSQLRLQCNYIVDLRASH